MCIINEARSAKKHFIAIHLVSVGNARRQDVVEYKRITAEVWSPFASKEIFSKHVPVEQFQSEDSKRERQPKNAKKSRNILCHH
ncbi:Oidioi.mRNA.OKI2018_I69.XSR.g14187.t1.cds [Oikopleura dioica]|uniref:Oidioi.mRNA.OKI2018_I69.XSR.g14187.t1.cds n=1 Tax=Oikopleura dioica TaxID=34765 RepID=A0ABN7SDX7_OIKDI|nr:Oidioi.mRNA.OKI2018_I69.XSR.g14187.t1.cds [Oikopleura dioica]